MWKLVSFYLLLVFMRVDCGKFFRNGRESGGNVGKPNGFKLRFPKQFPELWFTQKLDHFNPNNEVTWQQVLLYFYIFVVYFFN